MRKLVLVALVALCATFQGEVCAENSYSDILISNSDSKIGDIELEWVLNQVVDQTGLTYAEVRSLYDSGKLTIEKVEEGYRVTIENGADGGLIDILIGSGF